MSQTEQTIEERLDQLEQSHYELTELVHGGFESVRVMLKKIKDDNYEKQPEGTQDDLDLSLEEIQDTCNWIDKLMNPDDEEEE